MLYAVILAVHIVVSILLMAVVLLQPGRGAVAASFGGGGGSQALFGGRGATSFLSKATWVLGACFMVTSLILALAISHRHGTARPKSVLREIPIEAPSGAVPGGTPAGGQGTAPQVPSTQPTEPAPAPPAGGGSGGTK